MLAIESSRRHQICRRAARVVVLVSAVGTALAAQDKPDFAGRWVLESPAQPGADIPRTMAVVLVVRRTNVRGEPIRPFVSDIEIRREFESGVRAETRKIGIGGTVPGIRKDGTMNGSEERYAVTWDGADLVFENGAYTGARGERDVWTERGEVWSLDVTGRLRVVITTRGSNVKPSTVTLVYRRIE